MSRDDIVRLVSRSAGVTQVVVVPPAAGWRKTVPHMFWRLKGALNARVSLPAARDTIVWRASPGLRMDLPHLRQTLLGGRIYVNVRSDSPINRIRQSERFVPDDAIRVGSGGGLRQRGRWNGRPALLRLGSIDSPGDPGHHFEALTRFAFPEMPDPLATGIVGDMRWTIEAFVGGRHSTHMSDEQAAQIERFLLSLPPGRPLSESLSADVAVITRAAPSLDSDRLAGMIATRLAAVPSFATHGDFWFGNLLFDDQELTGVLDWDSWRDSGAPGTDLLHLKAEELRRARGVSYGDLVVEAYWNIPTIRSALDRYLAALGIATDPLLRSVIAAAWWLRASAGALSRTPELGSDRVWMRSNVAAACEYFRDQIS